MPVSVPCVGREHEREYLQSALGRAMNGDGDAILLSGPLGVGKTRLLEELHKVCNSLDCYHFECSGHPLDKVLLLPWIELSENMRELERISSVTKGHLDRFKKETSEWRTTQRVDAVDLELAISSLTEHRAVILLLDDVHMFDEASLHLTLDLIRAFHGKRVLIVATCDGTDGYRSDLFEQTLAVLRTEGLVTDLPIDVLDAENLRYLIEMRLEGPVDKDLWEYIQHASNGSPMHALETIALMEEKKVLIERDGKVRRDQTAIIDVPSELIGLVQRRSERLSRDGQRILEFRAMLGPYADLESLSQISHIGLERITDLLNEMSSDRGYLKKDGRFAFRHPSYERSLLNEISPLRRKEMHRAIGEFLKKRGMENVAPESLAMHFFMGDEIKKCQSYAHDSVLKCMAFSSFLQAMGHLDLMMEDVDSTPKDEAEWIMEELGDCNFANGSNEQAQSYYERCLDLGLDNEKKARILLKMFRCQKEMFRGIGDWKKKMELVDEILSLASSDDRIKGGAWLEKALLLREDGHLNDSEQAFHKANHLFEAAIDWHLLVDGLLEQIDLALRTDDLEQAYFLLMHVEELVDPDRDKKLKLRLDVTFADLFMMEGHYECSIRRYSEYIVKARRIGEYGIGSWCAFCKSLMLLDMTEFTLAVEAVEECEDMARLTGDDAHTILPEAMKVLMDVIQEKECAAELNMLSLKARRKGLSHPPMDISDGFIDLVDGILKFRLGQQMDGESAFGQGIFGLEGKRMGSFFQGLGKEWHGSMLLENGCKNKAKEQFQLSYGMFLQLGNTTHSERLASQISELESDWTFEELAL